ncbi:MAG: hypothetical protein ACRCTZ_14305 [Sarcina sp.]
MTEISKFLNEVIARKNIVMTDISELVGVSNQFLSDLKKGKKSCKEVTWKEIIKYLRLDKNDEEKAWRAWSLDRMDKKTRDYLLKLEEENDNLKKILSYVKFVKKEKNT